MKHGMINTLYQTARSLYRKGRYGDAVPLMEELLNQYQSLGDYDTVIRILIEIAHANNLMGKPQRAEECLKYAEKFLKFASHENQANFYVVKCGYLVSHGRVEEARSLLPEILAIKDSISGGALGSFYTNLAAGYISIGQYESAIRLTEEALPYLKENAPKNFTLALNNLGYLHIKIGEPETALVYLREAQKIAEQREFHDALAIIYDNLADIYIDYYQDYEQGYYYSSNAVRINEENNNKYQLVSSLINLARSLFYLGRYHELEEILKKIDKERISLEPFEDRKGKLFDFLKILRNEIPDVDLYPVDRVLAIETMFDIIDEKIDRDPGILQRLEDHIAELEKKKEFISLLMEVFLSAPQLAGAIILGNRAEINKYVYSVKKCEPFNKLREFFLHELKVHLNDLIPQDLKHLPEINRIALNYILEKIGFPFPL